MKRAKYQWGAKEYLAEFKEGEVRQYDSEFPWRSLASIASRMSKRFGMIFKFKTDSKTGNRTITRVI